MRARMQVPAPQRPWLSALFAGDRTALPARIAELAALIAARRDPLLDVFPDYSAGENWECARFNARVARAHERNARANAARARDDRATQRRTDATRAGTARPTAPQPA